MPAEDIDFDHDFKINGRRASGRASKKVIQIQFKSDFFFFSPHLKKCLTKICVE